MDLIRRMRYVCQTLWLCAVIWVPDALAWSHAAHQAVALAAENTLTPAARKNLQRLLSHERGASLASISTWADRQRAAGTAKWHYLNFPEDRCMYQAAQDCPDGACVISAANRQIAILRSTSANDVERLEALKYVVHLVADVHQPLHAGFAHDRGGNGYQVQAVGRGTNLHALWDNGLVHAIEPDPRKLADKLLASPPNVSEASSKPDRLMVEAAEESCRIVRSPWFYPSRQVSTDYMKQSTPVVLARLHLASQRLAIILNMALQK
ncbi:MAG: S1/P1 nuclease [Pseudomonadota bacterium]